MRDQFGPLRASQGMTRPVSSQLGHLKAILVLLGPLQVSMKINLSISEPHFVLQISQPPNITHKLFCIQNLHMGDFSQPQQEYAGTGENCNKAIFVIFYPGIKTS